jgi:hypothetical protein
MLLKPSWIVAAACVAALLLACDRAEAMTMKEALSESTVLEWTPDGDFIGIVPGSDHGGHENEIQYSTKEITGTIPTQIGLLGNPELVDLYENLRKVDFRRNRISGTIPSQLAFLAPFNT